jgi:hypothetical protein
MAADPDNFEDDCPSEDDTLSGEDADDSDDSEEVQSILTSIQSARARQRVQISEGNGSVTVSSQLSLFIRQQLIVLWYLGSACCSYFDPWGECSSSLSSNLISFRLSPSTTSTRSLPY